MFHVVEVIETKKAYKPGQKDDEGKPLFDGSILVRTGAADTVLGQVKNIWCAPATFNKRIPFIGEQVLVFEAPSTEQSATDFKTKRFFYFSPYNTVNNVSTHHFPLFWKRDKTTPPFGTKPAADILADKLGLGYTVSKNVKGTAILQPFEGDDIWQGRFGQSIRFTHTYRYINPPGPQLYQQNALTNWPGKGEFDPLAIIKVKFPGGGSGYDIEDIGTDQSSIYLTTSHKLMRFKAGSNNNCAVKGIPNWQGAQAVIDSDRIVLNAKNDDAFLIAKKRIILTGKKVQFQTEKHTVDLDTLMNWLKKFVDNFDDLVAGTAPLTTAMGPSGPGKNSPQVKKLATTDYRTRFKQKGCNSNKSASETRALVDSAVQNLKASAQAGGAASGGTGPVGASISSAPSPAPAGGGGEAAPSPSPSPAPSPADAGGATPSPSPTPESIGTGLKGNFGVFATRRQKRGNGKPAAQDDASKAKKRKQWLDSKPDSCVSKEAKARGFATNDAIGIPSAGVKFNHPVGVDFGERAAKLLRDNGMVCTDTNDYLRDDPPPSGHKNKNQQNGLSIDADFSRGEPSIAQLKKAFEDADALGLTLDWEVTPNERDRIQAEMIKAGYPKSIWSKVISPNHITGSHFSVYYKCK